MGKKLTHQEFLEKLWDKNEHYRNGKFKVVSEYKNSTTPILVEDIRGICKIDYASLINKNYTTSILTAIDATEYFKKELLETNKVKMKVHLRQKLSMGDKAAEILALYKLICSDEERKALQMVYSENKHEITEKPDISKLTDDELRTIANLQRKVGTSKA